MINEAIGKITDEMMKEQNNPAIVAIEEYLTNICTTEAVAQKLLSEGKSLSGAFNAIKEAARKRQVGGCGYVPPEEGFEIVEEYYGITEEDKQKVRTVKKSSVIDITDLL